MSFPFLLSFGLLIGCDGENHDHAGKSNPYAGYKSELYAGTQNWLCNPELAAENSACKSNVDATLVFADGSTQLELATEEENPSVDCFYVYPTVSLDRSPNSDLVVSDREESVVVKDQGARYRAVCEIYAPVYRQRTLSSLLGIVEPGDFDVAYRDVLDAFKQYVAHANGRGFILIGHSQGSRHLVRLIQEEVETNPWLREHMITAHILGHTVALPNEAEFGATFQNTPPCTSDNDIHCFVSYTSFRESEPPEPETSGLGITDSDATRAACTNPNRLGGGKLNLDAYFASSKFDAFTELERNEAIKTPFFKLPGLIQGECIEQDGKGYLAISYDADPNDPRTDDVGGDFLPGWGLHIIDFDLAQGDLVRLAKSQADSWLERREAGD